MAKRTSPILELGRATGNVVVSVGEVTLFAIRLFNWMFTRRPWRSTIVPNMYQIGVLSVPVVAITGTFIGMVLAVQAYSQFKSLGLESRLGVVVNSSLVTELGPVLAATMLAGRIGGAMAAEIATMKVTEQIDALRVLGANPIHYLAVPRFIACVTLIPLLTIIADFMGIIGGAIVSTQVLHIDAFHYWRHSRMSVGSWEIFCGLFKTFFFGAEIAIISCFRGFRSTGGAEGVGQSATAAFVHSFVAILASDFFLGMFLNGVYEMLWPNYRSSLIG